MTKEIVRSYTRGSNPNPCSTAGWCSVYPDGSHWLQCTGTGEHTGLSCPDKREKFNGHGTAAPHGGIFTCEPCGAAALVASPGLVGPVYRDPNEDAYFPPELSYRSNV